MARFSVEAVFKAIDKITAPVTRMQNAVGKATRSMEKGLRAIDSAIGSVASGLKNAGAFALKWATIGIGAVTAGVTLLVREFSKIEDARAAFTPLLGSAERAQQLVDALNKTAATTPFQLEDLAATANQLLPVMNGNIEKTISTIRMLGDTAGGNAQKLDSITRGFTKAMLKGKVDMESLNMIAEAGVPIFTELADTIGVKMGPAFFKMVSAGKITTKQLEQAFQRMTGSGGRFFRGMEIASETVSGRWSSFMDAISMTAAELGGALAPAIKDVIIMATGYAERLREWIAQNRELIATRFAEYVKKIVDFGIMLIDNWDKIAEKAAFWIKVAGWILGVVVALKAFAAIMTVINLIMAANPIVLIIMAIIAAITVLVVYFDEIKAGLFDLDNAFGGFGRAIINFIGGPIGMLLNGLITVIGLVKEALQWMGVLDDTEASVDVNNTTTVVSPQERAAAFTRIEQSRSTAELLIRDETGRAELKAPDWAGGTIKLQPSGTF